MQRRSLVVSGLGALVLPACGGSDDSGTPAEDMADEVDALDEALHLSKAQGRACHRAVNLLELVDGTRSSGKAVNRRGQVVGWADSGEGGPGSLAMLWSPGRDPVVLPSLGTDGNTAAFGINRFGVVVGRSFPAGGARFAVHATVWTDGHPTDLGTLRGPGVSEAFGINDAGWIVGWSNLDFGARRATLWRDGQIVNLEANGGADSLAWRINEAGSIVGFRQTFLPEAGYAATVWQADGSRTELIESGLSSFAHDLNDDGTVVGYSQSHNDVLSNVAKRWVGGRPLPLPALEGGRAIARAVNRAGLMVGTSSRGSSQESYAVLWTPQGDRVIDLNSCLDDATRDAGWVLQDALAIGDGGHVTGDAFNARLSLNRAYRLSLRRGRPR